MPLKPIAILATLALAGPATAQDSLTVYSAGPANLIEALAEGFTAASGTRVDVFQGTTGQVLARIEAEAQNPVVDVLISASWETAEDFAARGWLLPYTSPHADAIPAFLQTEFAVAQGVSALAIAWNPSSGTPRPEDWADLADPAFADLVTMPDPVQSGSAFELVAGLAAIEGGMELFEDLAGNGMVVPGANAQALNPVLQGAKAAVFGAVDYIAMGRAAAGETVEVIFPASGTVIAPRPAMIMEWTRNEDAARAFLDYLLSDAGQAMVAEVYLMPARTDVPADRPLIGDLDLLDLDAGAAYAARDRILAEFNRAVGR
jgi:iron(III) transport system substrate-binding protein